MKNTGYKYNQIIEDGLCVGTINTSTDKPFDAVVCDLDGTLIHPRKEAIPIKGRSGMSYLGRDAADILTKISKIIPIIIATGRNAASTARLVRQLPDARFSGFVLENGFVVKQDIDDPLPLNGKWDSIAALFPHWERLSFYENCVGFVPPPSRDDLTLIVKNTLKENGYTDLVYKENKKIYVYPGKVDKMRGLSLLGAHPYIAMGDEINDIQMMKKSSICVTLSSAIAELKEIVKEKKGFCSPMTSHEGARDMLDFTYKKINSSMDF